MRTCRLFLLTAVLTGLLAAGCSGPKLEFTDAAEGTLTLDGKPVPNTLVQFVPEVPDGTTAPTSSGTTDDKGFFRLTRSDNQKPGALVGRHKVVILPGRTSGDRDDQAPAAVPQVPTIYMSAGKTPFNVDVTRDKKTYDLPIRR